MNRQANLHALRNLAGLGSAYCSKNFPKTQGVARGFAISSWGTPSNSISSWGTPSRGFGASGASAFTMTAAQALSDYLVTNNCAGCSDMTSQLRQLTFAFKAAYLTDTGIAPQVALNMNSALAMTAYGVGTDQALKNVLGAAAYTGGPCTDDNGNCLGNRATPIIPPAVLTLEQQVVHAIQAAIQQSQLTPQSELANGLAQSFAALINQISFELAKLSGGKTVPVAVVTPATTTAPATGWTTTEKVVVGVAVGAAAALLYYAGKRN